jgi:hypothetical protein
MTATGALAADRPAGALTQLEFPDGCYKVLGDSGCGAIRGIDDFKKMEMSPDGRLIFAIGEDLAILKRNQVTGRLSQPGGINGCVADDGHDEHGGLCSQANEMGNPKDIAISPDMQNAYVITAAGITIFKLDVDNGLLTQLTGDDGCYIPNPYPDPNPGCKVGNGIASPQAVTVSPDGQNVYVTGTTENPPYNEPDAVAAFHRDALTGALTQLAGDAGCVSEAGATEGCRDGYAMREIHDIAMSGDSKFAYAAVSEARSPEIGAILVLKRDDPTGDPTTDGALSMISCNGTGDLGCAQGGTGLVDAHDLIVSPDQRNVYVASQGDCGLNYPSSPCGGNGGTVSSFSRDAETGLLTQLQCISDDGGDGNGNMGECEIGRNLGEPTGLAMGRDPTMLYVADQGGPTLFSRNPASGRLVQLAGPDGCINDQQNDKGYDCAMGYQTEEASSVVVAPGCDFVYFGGHERNGNYDANMTVFYREQTCMPVSTAAAASCTRSTSVAVSVRDFMGGTAAKWFHYKLDGGPEQVLPVGASGTGTVNVPPGKHVLEYWGEDVDHVIERAWPPFPIKAFPPHRAEITVDTTSPTVTITSDQGKTRYTQGQKGTITVAASDDGSLAADPSAKAEPISTSKTGTFTVTKTATDACGNSATARFAYTVVKKVKRLRLSVKPAAATVGQPTTFTFKVTYGGKPVSGATVRVAGKVLKTNSKGVATTTIDPAKAGNVRAKASKKGYRSAAKNLKVRSR